MAGKAEERERRWEQKGADRSGAARRAAQRKMKCGEWV
jgi:hypothetical protein